MCIGFIAELVVYWCVLSYLCKEDLPISVRYYVYVYVFLLQFQGYVWILSNRDGPLNWLGNSFEA